MSLLNLMIFKNINKTKLMKSNKTTLLFVTQIFILKKQIKTLKMNILTKFQVKSMI